MTPAACLLLMDFDTAWLLHAGDHRVVRDALGTSSEVFTAPCLARDY